VNEPPARRLLEPKYVFVQALQARLRAEAGTAFAGVAYAPDRALEIFSTGGERLAAIVAELAPRAGSLRLRIVPGATNSLEDLEALERQVASKMPELERRGVKITSADIDIRGNRLELGIGTVTPETVAALEAAFGGPGRVRVVKIEATSPAVGEGEATVRKPADER
jgi:hypothetical protein